METKSETVAPATQTPPPKSWGGGSKVGGQGWCAKRWRGREGVGGSTGMMMCGVEFVFYETNTKIVALYS